jgi:hypothetical protein
MLTKIQYSDLVERQLKIDENKDKMLIEEQNITEGNFLIFTDIKPIENQLNDIKNNTDMIILKQEGLL